MGYEINPLTIPLAKFRVLPAEVREEFRQQVIKLSGKLIQRFLIDGGDYWMLVCGDTRAIRASAKVEERVYPAEIIAEFEERMGVPAYGIFRHEVLPKEG